MLTGLEDAGIIRRERVAGDRRGVRVELTEKGRTLLDAKRDVVDAKRRALFASLTETEREQAEHLFRRFAEAFDIL